MRCPECQSEALPERYRCGVCTAEFTTGDAEELEHLAYLQTWLRQSYDDRVLTGRRLDALLQRAYGRTATLTAAPSSSSSSSQVTTPTVPAEPAPVRKPPQPRASRSATQAQPRRNAPSVSWSVLGAYLLSERTLHALLALGAFLILASGVVISLLNPTGLGPLLHLSVVLCTTLLFYAAGYVVRQRLHLALTGAALLAIGGAFVPLCVWTIGQELLGWPPAAVWLLASTVSLPIYLASHVALRDRTSAVLLALAGGSEVLALANWFGVPLEWGLVLLIGLGCAYVWTARRLDGRWATLAWGLAWTAQVSVPCLMLVLLRGRFFPSPWQPAGQTQPMEIDEYAVGAAWWLGAAFFGIASTLPGQRWCRVAALWTVPVAYLLTLTKAPWAAAWHGVALVGLAGVYLAYGHWRRADRGGTYRTLAAEPIYQVAGLLTVLAALWPAATGASRIVTLLGVAGVYAVAAQLLRRRACAYVALALLPIAFGLLLDQLQIGGELVGLAWTGLAIILLGCAEAQARWTAENRRAFVETVTGRGAWRSPFTAPLFSVGYLVSVTALGLTVGRWWNTQAQPEAPTLVALLALTCVAITSSILRRTSFFVFVASWLFLVPFEAVAVLAYAQLGRPMNAAELARLLAVLGVGYVLAARAVDRFGGHYARAIYLVGYCLSVATMPLSVMDRAINTQVVGLSIAIYAVSAWWVQRGRHPAFMWVAATRHLEDLFAYLACGLFPLWLVLAASLRWPPPETADYGVGLVALGIVYLGVGVLVHHRSLDPSRLRQPIRAPGDGLARPFFVVALAVCALGLTIVFPEDRGRTVLAFTLASGLFAAAAWVFRLRLLGYALVGAAVVAYVVGMTLTSLDGQAYGLGLLPGMLAFFCVGELLRRCVDARSTASASGLLERWSTPFFLVTYTGTLAVPMWSTASPRIWAAAWLSVTFVYALSVAAFRRPVWLYPTLLAGLVAWVASLMVVIPGVSGVVAVATLIGPADAMFGVACVSVRAKPWKPTLEALSEARRLPAAAWSDPLVAVGWLALLVAVGGGAVDPVAGLWAAATAMVVLGAVATLWSGRTEAWLSLCIAALAFWQVMFVAAVPPVAQPPRWALAGLALSLLAIGVRRTAWPQLKIWLQPMQIASLAVGGTAMLPALGAVNPPGHSVAVQMASATVATTGLTLVAHGFDLAKRWLAYCGVGLLLIGYILQLTFFEVGQPQAFAFPAAAYLFAIAYLEWRRGTRGRVKAVLEVAGLVLLLGVTLMQSVGLHDASIDRYAYATILLLEGVAVFGLGALLHWRRSFFVGALAVVVDVAILLADPLRAMNTWYLVAVIGLAMIAAVVVIEQRRQRIPLWVSEWRLRLKEEWD